jgi:hypothetical protein
LRRAGALAASRHENTPDGDEEERETSDDDDLLHGKFLPIQYDSSNLRDRRRSAKRRVFLKEG